MRECVCVCVCMCVCVCVYVCVCVGGGLVRIGVLGVHYYFFLSFIYFSLALQIVHKIINYN